MLAGCSRAPEENGLVALPTQPFAGDLDGIRERKVLRALVVPSRTDFFLSGARIEGLQTQLLREYEKYLNRGIRRETDKVRIRFLPVTFDRLIAELQAGNGDIAAAMLTVTPERMAQVAMVSAEAMPVDEVLVRGRDVEPISHIDELSGREVVVLRGSSFAEHLRALNRRFALRAMAPVRITEADPWLQSEDILELVNAGVVALTVVDDYMARLWSRVLTNIVVHDDVVLHTDGHIGWATRHGNPQLQASVREFLNQVKLGTVLGNLLTKSYLGQTRWIENPTSGKNLARLERLKPLFDRYGKAYDIDPLALLALAYHESALDQGTRSRRGAVGLMQILPSTARDPNVNIPDIHKVENNVHAGAKYLAFLRERYFSDADIEPQARMEFVWAAYNAGPARVAQMRTLAKKMGLDPNRWFGHVEVAAGRIVGRETVKYVADIKKYLIAYRLLRDHARIRSSAQ
jgi:membrane-bound lytic murein transglycosylase MltF